MFAASFEPAALLPALYYTLAGVVLGFIFEKIILVKMRSAAKKINSQRAQIVTDSLRGLGMWIVGLIGLYYAIPTLLLQEAYAKGFEMAIIVAGIAIVTWIMRRVSVRLISLYTHREGSPFPQSSIFTHITQITILSLGLLIALQTLGISITPLITAMGVGGLAIALGLQDTIGNLFAGLTVLASKKIVPGDIIEVENDKKGTVNDISWRYTTIKTPDGHTVVLPNSKLAAGTITNFSQPTTEVGFNVMLRLPYDVNLAEVETLLTDVAYRVMQKEDGSVKEHMPTVRFKEFGQMGIETKIFVRAQTHDAQYKLQHELVKAVHAALTEKGISMPHTTERI